MRNIINYTQLLSGKYAIVATNPPYMNKYDAKLKKYITTYYKDYSGDLFSVFMFRNFGLCKQGGYSGFMTPFVWMFIKTYEKLRNLIIRDKAIVSLVQMEYSAFEEATVPVCAFILKNGKDNNLGCYFKLSDFKGGMEVQRAKVEEALNNRDCGYFYETDIANYSRIPGMAISYWLSERALENFESGILLNDMAEIRQGLATSDNNRYLRLWYEVERDRIDFESTSTKDAKERGYRWFPFNKGGAYRKWYGNQEYIVDYYDDGADMKANVLKKYPYLNTPDFVVKNTAFYFLPSITWTEISSTYFGVRYCPACSIFSNKSNSIFPENEYDLWYLLALLCSKPADMYIKAINPTITTNVGDVARIPVIQNEEVFADAYELVKENIELEKADWDDNETSWEFERHPLANGSSIAEAYKKWEKVCEQRLLRIKENEEELNRRFIEIYGLTDEMSPEVERENITVKLADLSESVKSFISYAVGCMFGRFSLEIPGVVFSGGTWNNQNYDLFIPDGDNIIPVSTDDYFEDDILGRFIEFVECLYGKDSLEENLSFIANAIGGKGSSREIIRDYFINGFYADHIKRYQKRPIYWLFDSGKKNGFKCLIYMHRYHPDTIARIRTDYVHEQQSRYRTALADLEQRINSASTSERVKLNKQLKAIQDQAEELRKYEEKIHHLADQMISIDLDDGVKVNYTKFQDVLAKIK